ncbi:hypothetical protein HQN90_04565 [Paenibacillus alba]|uniref:hypothetical protein n=1 Tax=Paenibacillus alba TaxID=1197127 RepID=UPI00156317AF|nr:hypothetical protein [Paenibacillus alba]NQX65396.1 hypothetical protein [Paenibacillus alba]
MEQLIEFLVKHWYLVIIAITFLYQLNNKKRSGKQGAPQSRMPSFGETSRPSARPAEATKPDRQGFGGPAPQSSTADDFGRSNNGSAKAAAPKSKASPFGSSSQAGIESSPIYANAISSSNSFPEELKQEQLLQGVVWAEILGPPRSKKPLRRS